jgi:hypothetical protein
MKRSLREVLAQSHVASVTIAVLLLGFINTAFQTFWTLIAPALSVLATAIAIFGIPFISWTYTRMSLITASTYVCSAAINFSAAWLLSRWIYRSGPFRSLIRYYDELIGRNHV